MRKLTMYGCSYCNRTFETEQLCTEHEEWCRKHSFVERRIKMSVTGDDVSFERGSPEHYRCKVKEKLTVSWDNWSNRLVFAMVMPACMSEDECRLALLKKASAWLSSKSGELDLRISAMKKKEDPVDGQQGK